MHRGVNLGLIPSSSPRASSFFLTLTVTLLAAWKTEYLRLTVFASDPSFERKRNKEFPLGSFAARPAPFRRSCTLYELGAYYISDSPSNRQRGSPFVGDPYLRKKDSIGVN